MITTKRGVGESKLETETMTQAIAKMLLVICADEVMIPMRPHPSGNKKRSPPILEENPSDRPCQILEGSDHYPLMVMFLHHSSKELY